MNFWGKLKKPIMILAPMDGVTDTVFRQIVISVSKPDVVFTEFVPVDALNSKGKEKALTRLKFDKVEKPIIAQIWGNKPENFFKSAQLITELGFDGIDINMGCPSEGIVKAGSCAGLIKNPKLAREIIEATIKGAGNLPVSVKTRIGFNTIEIEDWVTALLSTPIAALTLHLRTVKELSRVPAHWDEIKKAVELRNRLNSKALIIGNGDIKSLKEARLMCDKFSIDGVMIGTGIFENVWLFNENVDIDNVAPKQKIDLLIKHLELYKLTHGEGKRFQLMKKFVKCYVNNFQGALESRESLMKTKTLEELMNQTLDLSNNLSLL